MEKMPLIAVVGPTASGKTALAVALAQKLNGEVISADSMQVYKYMNIGTAKPSYAEMCGVPHHIMDCISPDTEFNVAVFSKMAKDCIEKISMQGKMPILAGGTGMYIDNVLQNIKLADMKTDYILRKFFERTAEQKGNEYVHRMLSEVDLEAAINIHPNNIKRVIRALEVYYLTGMTITEQKKNSKKEESPYNDIVFMPEWDRESLYKRIDMRVDNMINDGLVNEVKTLMRMGYTRELNSMQGIGYKEVFDYLEGKTSLEDTIDIIKRNSRRYAKRQLTWFNRHGSIVRLDPQGDMVDQAMTCIREKFGEI